ncbi:uncharacterized protein N7518_005300 [Penicillium psychrosexuale]|uniref:uncharacterized protein n=1 Tax=Penicillium psychrosexuale TaxID=1002107 RepID=UPI002544D3D5|nr:uncharacterized protein N7518_005300 [Penicillium psychrosexuale]KAJ5796760.1 hypothetical protein N7518_005300 [Penicillium psychrosexuale]
MSGSSDTRWRGGPSRQGSQRNSNNRDKTGGQGSARDNNATWGASNPPQEQHVPVRGFNTAEVKNVLKVQGLTNLSRYSRTSWYALSLPPYILKPNLCAIDTETKSAVPYKSHSKDGPTQRSTAWGAKAQNMANGRDFFLELRKQITSLQRSGPPVGG